jgi:TPR repeat protein
MSTRLVLRLAPTLFLLGACEGLDNFARSVDEAAATIIPADTTTEAGRSYRQGLAHLNGDGAIRDEAKAAALFRDAADRGSPDAAYQLGLLYQRGAGVPQHDGIALEWLEKAAALGHGDAQLLAGQAYATGRGTPKDMAWAARWYGKAADQGITPAQHLLGMAYATGQGLPRDRVAAYSWLSLAAAKKDENAMRERATLAKQMSKAEIAVASARVRAWKAQSNLGLLDAPTVRFAQLALTDLGYPPGPVDGQFGPRTREALSAWQAKAGLSDNGVLDAAALERLKGDRLPAASVAGSTR